MDGTPPPASPPSAPVTVAAVEEQIEVSTNEVETGRVRISKHVTERHETVDVPLLHEEVEIRRVPVNRAVDAPVPVRHEGDVTIVPVFEEVLVLSKQLVLKEELHISRRRTEVRDPQEVVLRSERVEITRTPTDRFAK
ncbi:MAG: YsnF/AvaK domain-containing protein [Methylibium sp.]|nr:YsnF/AvaK domain-containing protein [Methylibium sp.]